MSLPAVEPGTTSIAVAVAVGLVCGSVVMGVLSCIFSWVSSQVKGIFNCGKIIVIVLLLVVSPVAFVSIRYVLPYACKACRFYKIDYVCPPVLSACGLRDYVFQQYSEFNISDYTKFNKKRSRRRAKQDDEEDEELVNDTEETQQEEEEPREEEEETSRKKKQKANKERRKKATKRDKSEPSGAVHVKNEQEYDI
jgi:hypothetical protein